MCKIGLVLSGGMAKGAYQVGALKCIKEYLACDDIAYISASSIGVLNAYAFTTDKLELAEQIWKDVCCEDNRRIITSIVKDAFLQHSIRQLINNDDNISPYFYETLYSVKNNTLSYVNLHDTPDEKRYDYLKASIAMPLYNKPIAIGNDKFFDGAIIDNIPVYPLQKHFVDYIICIYFDDCNYIFENQFLDSRIIKIRFNDSSIIKSSISMDKNSVALMIDKGYIETKALLSKIFASGTEDANYIYNKITLFNKNQKGKFRITGDMVVNNCNKIAKKLIRKRCII